jgi:hypothetical protein
MREIGREDYYPTDSSQSSSAATTLNITANDLFGDDKTAIEDNVPICDKTAAAHLPTKDLRVQIDQGIEEHIANII